MDENARFILTFITNTGVKDEYEIPRANTELTETEISERMSAIVGNGNFATTSGVPAQAFSAELIETTVSEII